MGELLFLDTIRNYVFFQNPKLVPERKSLKTSKSGTDAKIQGDTDFNGMHLIHIEFYWMSSCIVYLPDTLFSSRPHELEASSRGYDCTKPRALYNHPCIHPLANSHNFVTDVFPLSITVGPNHKSLCASGFQLQILLYVFLVCRNGNLDRSLKKTERVTSTPGLEGGSEILSHKVSYNCGDGILGPRLGIIEVIVLDVFRRAIALAESKSRGHMVDGFLNSL